MPGTEAATPSLDALLDAFNAHDVDAIMSFFTEDCVFDTPRGPADRGARVRPVRVPRRQDQPQGLLRVISRRCCRR
jgi:hypothetical protein